MKKYYYNGPVMYFDKCVCDRYSAETVAATPAKAKSNLAYRYKMENNMVPATRISLPGKIEEVSI